MKRSAWSSTIIFVDPVYGDDVWMRVGVKPEGRVCISNDATARVTTVPIPPQAKDSLCGRKHGRKWYEHDRAVGVIELHRGNGWCRDFPKLGWKHVKGESRVFSLTFVLPNAYEWTKRNLTQVVNFKRKPVPTKWKVWRHNILIDEGGERPSDPRPNRLSGQKDAS